MDAEQPTIAQRQQNRPALCSTPVDCHLSQLPAGPVRSRWAGTTSRHRSQQGTLASSLTLTSACDRTLTRRFTLLCNGEPTVQYGSPLQRPVLRRHYVSTPVCQLLVMSIVLTPTRVLLSICDACRRSRMQRPGSFFNLHCIIYFAMH